MCDGGVGGLRHFFQLFEFTFEVEVFIYGIGNFFLAKQISLSAAEFEQQRRFLRMAFWSWIL